MTLSWVFTPKEWSIHPSLTASTDCSWSKKKVPTTVLDTVKSQPPLDTGAQINRISFCFPTYATLPPMYRIQIFRLAKKKEAASEGGSRVDLCWRVTNIWTNLLRKFKNRFTWQFCWWPFCDGGLWPFQGLLVTSNQEIKRSLEITWYIRSLFK